MNPRLLSPLAALSSRELYRLSHATGQAKIVLAEIPTASSPAGPRTVIANAGFTISSRTSSGLRKRGPRRGPSAISRDCAGPRAWAGDVGSQAWG